LRCVPAVQDAAAKASGDERTGLTILAHALATPARQIADNSGMDGALVVEHMRQTEGPMGFDAQRGVFVDLVVAGILDPTKVVRTALENAVSVASVLLLTEATLTEIDTAPPDRSPDYGEATGL
jgi:chaperonin GroEL